MKFFDWLFRRKPKADVLDIGRPLPGQVYEPGWPTAPLGQRNFGIPTDVFTTEELRRRAKLHTGTVRDTYRTPAYPTERRHTDDDDYVSPAAIGTLSAFTPFNDYSTPTDSGSSFTSDSSSSDTGSSSSGFDSSSGSGDGGGGGGGDGW